MVLKWILGLLLLAPLSPAFGFVLLSGPDEARLVLAEGETTISFLVSPNPPKIVGKWEFADGALAGLSDQEFWIALVRMAMDQWTQVEGAHIPLSVSFSDDAQLDSDDRVHSIVVSQTNQSSSAYAAPQNQGPVIYDCDIAVSERASTAKFLAYTLLHELGHCLGLGHNHADYRAVMGYSRSDHGLTLGLDDEAGLIYLYPKAEAPKARELVSCGLLGAGAAAPMSSYLLLGLPLMILVKPSRFYAVTLTRKRRKRKS